MSGCEISTPAPDKVFIDHRLFQKIMGYNNEVSWDWLGTVKIQNTQMEAT
jgi:hypothetical protein